MRVLAMCLLLAAVWLVPGVYAVPTQGGFEVPLPPEVKQNLAESQPKFNNEKKLAILVGIEEYLNIEKLNYTVDDMLILKAELESQGYVVKPFLSGFHGDIRYPDKKNREYVPTRQIIIEYLKSLNNSYTKDTGTILFAFSGHGFSNRQEKNYLATLDTQPLDFQSTALPLDTVKQLLIATGARRQLLFLDACRNNPEDQKKSVILQSENYGFRGLDAVEASGMAILFSTSQKTYSWEAKKQELEDSGLDLFDDVSSGHGIFTYFLVKGLRGDAQNSMGLITFESLAQYVNQTTTDWSTRLKPRPQIPRATKIETLGTFIIADAMRRSPSSASTGLRALYSKPWFLTTIIGAAVLLLAAGYWFFYRREPLAAGAYYAPDTVRVRALNFYSPQAVGYVCTADDNKAVAAILPNQILSVGRAADADLHISETAISSSHLQLGWDSTTHQFWIEDLGSANGTYYHQQPIQPKKRCYIEEGEVFHLASAHFGFRIFASNKAH